jgi:hypothetical protein
MTINGGLQRVEEPEKRRLFETAIPKKAGIE